MLKQLSKGFNANQLKWVALIFMTVDHIAAYILSAGTGLIQSGVLKGLGRIAAPLFLFVLTESIRHTSNKRKLILRLYIAGVLGSLFALSFAILANKYIFPGPVYMGVSKNILFTYAYTAIYICLFERGMKATKAKNLKGVFLTVTSTMATFLPQIAYYFYDGSGFSSTEVGFVPFGRELLAAFFPPTFFVEYSLMFVLMGICIYFAKGKWKCLVFSAFCLLSYVGSPIVGDLWPFTDFFWDGQAQMILALPFMLLYNGEKGTAYKNLFYVYYPVHRELLSFVGVLMEA